MATTDLLPGTDPEFDIMQAVLVAAVVTNALAWSIPAAEVTKLTTAQTPWTTTWAIAKDKQNCTTAQRKAKDLARAAFKKVLRAFIQKWIYRNEAMDDSDVEECGLKPRDTAHTKATKPVAGTVSAERGGMGELVAKCLAQKGAKYYGCVMVEGGPLPDWLTINAQGRIVLDNSTAPPKPEADKISGFQWDLTPQRVKKFTNLKHGLTYFFYFYVVNSAGVSPLSEGVSIVCW